MNSGKYVFFQLLEFVNRYEFDECVKRYSGNYRVRHLDSWNQFVQLFFGQLTSLNSLQGICLCLKAHKKKLYHLGIKQNVAVSTLSRANEKRDWRIFADFANYSSCPFARSISVVTSPKLILTMKSSLWIQPPFRSVSTCAPRLRGNIPGER